MTKPDTTAFLNFLKEIDAQVPEGLDIHIVMDNYATHKTPQIKAWLARRPDQPPGVGSFAAGAFTRLLL